MKEYIEYIGVIAILVIMTIWFIAGYFMNWWTSNMSKYEGFRRKGSKCKRTKGKTMKSGKNQ